MGNFTDSWHSAFNKMLIKHPLIYSLIDSFRLKNQKTDNAILRLELETQQPPKRRPNWAKLDEQYLKMSFL